MCCIYIIVLKTTCFEREEKGEKLAAEGLEPRVSDCSCHNHCATCHHSNQPLSILLSYLHYCYCRRDIARITSLQTQFHSTKPVNVSHPVGYSSHISLHVHTYVCRIKECGTIVYSDDYILEFKGCQIKEHKGVYGHIASSPGDNMTATRMQIAQGEYQPGEKKPFEHRLSGTRDMQSLQASATDPGGFVTHDQARSHRLRPQRLTGE